MMKRLLIISMFALVCAMSASGQISMRQFMKDAVAGEPFEVGCYQTREDMPVLGAWMGGLNKNPVKGARRPVAGSPLSWTGYGERDKSIVLGSSFPSGVHGQRPLTYGFQRSITTGSLYLSFITDFKSVVNRKYWTAVGFSTNTWGVEHWCCSVFYPAANDGNSYNVGIRLLGGHMVVDRVFKTNEKHLIVLKYDMDAMTLSVFIDPDLSKPEPMPDEKVTAPIPASTNMISGLYFRDVSDNVGRIGSFRVAREWEDIR